MVCLISKHIGVRHQHGTDTCGYIQCMFGFKSRRARIDSRLVELILTCLVSQN
jgi:hypothetical protein